MNEALIPGHHGSWLQLKFGILAFFPVSIPAITYKWHSQEPSSPLSNVSLCG